MSWRLLPDVFQQTITVNGQAAVGYTIEAFIFNTTTPTPLATDSAGAGQATSFTLNSRGAPQASNGTEVSLYCDTTLTEGLKLVLKDADGAIVRTYAGPVYAPASSGDLVAGSITYGGGSVEDALDDMMVVSGERQGFVAGTNIDAEMADWCTDFQDTGVVLKLRPGAYTITAHYEIQGWTLDLSNGAEININGSTNTVFVDGGIELLENGRMVGGIVYTSGDMTGPFSSSPTARPCAVLVNGGEIDGTEVYSQLNTGVKYYSGKVKTKVYGGSYHGFFGYFLTDVERHMEVETFNTGVRYIAKVPEATATLSTVFACLLRFDVDIDKPTYIKFRGAYSSRQGLWITADDPATELMSALFVDNPYFLKAGTYLASGTTETSAGGSATACEIIGCPNVRVVNPISDGPLGYNLVLADCNDGIVLGGSSIGVFGDPNVLLLRSDRAKIIDHTAENGTVGIGVTNCNDAMLIRPTLKNCTYGPVRWNVDEEGQTLIIDGALSIGGSDAASYTGTISGGNPGALYDWCRVSDQGTGVTTCNMQITNSTFNGLYTQLIAPLVNTLTVSVTEDNNSYLCPFVPPPVGSGFRARGVYFTPVRAIPIISGSGGRAQNGLITIDSVTDNTSVVMSITDLEPYIGTLATPSADADDYYLAWWFQYTTSANAGVRIGIDDSGSSSTSRYAVTTSWTQILDNAVNIYTNGYAVGDWIPMFINLRSAIYSGVTDFSALTRLQVIKFNHSPNYELIMTNPVIVMRRAVT